MVSSTKSALPRNKNGKVTKAWKSGRSLNFTKDTERDDISLDDALDLLGDWESDENQATSDDSCDDQLWAPAPAVDENNNTTSFVQINGARVIDVTYLVDQLSEGCRVCGEMSLDRITREVRRGLASVYHISCSKCEVVKLVHTSKYHSCKGKDNTNGLNTKAAAGNLLHACTLCMWNCIVKHLYVDQIWTRWSYCSFQSKNSLWSKSDITKKIITAVFDYFSK